MIAYYLGLLGIITVLALNASDKNNCVDKTNAPQLLTETSVEPVTKNEKEIVPVAPVPAYREPRPFGMHRYE